MITYTVGQHLIAADTPESLVNQMHKSSHTQETNDQAFMVQVANRTKLQTGADVRTDTADNFVRDLIAAGMIERGE